MNYKRNDILFGLHDVFITLTINYDGSIGVEKRSYAHLEPTDYFDKRMAQDLRHEYVRVHGSTLNYWMRLYDRSTERTELTKEQAKRWAIWYHRNRHNLKTYQFN